jgi:inward rectifier potassium channel
VGHRPLRLRSAQARLPRFAGEARKPLARHGRHLQLLAWRPKLRPVKRSRTFRAPGADYQIRIVGLRPSPLRDFYHGLLRRSWGVTIAVIAGAFLVVNTLFALGFMLTGGIANARPGSFADAFFFSAQTTGTIGYGALYPQTTAANVLVVAEAIVGLTLTALATGLVFSKFSRSTARVAFTREAVISPLNGVPTLMFRVSNERGNEIVDTQIRVVLSRTEHTAEGATFYRMHDLKLTRDRALSLSRSWTVFHTIDGDSPLRGITPEKAAADEIEIGILVVGLDDITMQTVHARHRYFSRQMLWGHRHADIITETDDGNLLMDLGKFHDLEPTRPTPEFPYPAEAAALAAFPARSDAQRS